MNQIKVHDAAPLLSKRSIACVPFHTKPEGGAVAESLIPSGIVQVYAIIIGGPGSHIRAYASGDPFLVSPRPPPPIV
ncbi:unnamed protein product [Microthlaspi erraticum]|uniref:Uncharacterized protein n=1 Tax=Microthlaspi erraticum TaxID=1685480 RepID=A0A6D2LJK0_9BRAS|nr:unnamed protein product [Microthlaspi erraticum]